LRRYREHYPEQKHLFLLTKGISQVDIAGAELIINEVRERRSMGGDVYLYRLRDTASRVFKRGGYQDEVGEANIFDGKEDAIPAIFERLDKSICATCDHRIFLECKSVPRAGTEDSEATEKTEAPISDDSAELTTPGVARKAVKKAAKKSPIKKSVKKAAGKTSRKSASKPEQTGDS
jgi:MFS superfamily sulfate permease-like transporter